MGGFGKFVVIAGAVIFGFIFLSFVFNSTSKQGGFGVLTQRGGFFSNLSNNATQTDSTNQYGVEASHYNVSLSSGNARSEGQPSGEYVTIRNNGEDPVNITGWTFKNSKGERPVNVVDETYIYQHPDVALIPIGALLLDPSGRQIVTDIILKRGEEAIVTTGGPFPSFPLPIVYSFKENICVGYLEHEGYPFNPGLNRDCPYIEDEEGVNSLTEECYDYVKTLSRCEIPEETEKEYFEAQRNSCQKFIKSKANYPACVALHGLDQDFFGDTWRVFLGKSFEMWGRKDTIYLYDIAGNLVDKDSY